MKRIHRGDDGYTDILGLRLPKDSPIIEFIGDVDELASMIGVVKSILRENNLHHIVNSLTEIQKTLLHIASYVARGGVGKAISPITQDDISILEKTINNLWSVLDINKLVIPGSSKESALLHLLRAVCRRTERRAATLLRSGIIDSLTYVYLNRLSDWLYVTALYVNKMKKIEEDYL